MRNVLITVFIALIFSYIEYRVSEILIKDAEYDYKNINTDNECKCGKNTEVIKGLDRKGKIKDKKLLICIFIITATSFFIIINSGIEKYKIVSAVFLLPFLMIASVVDIKTKYIYDMICISGIVVQMVIAIALYGFYGLEIFIYGVSVCFLCSFIIAYITRAMGYGDVFMYAMCGSAISCTEPFNIIPSSFIIACIYCITVYLVGINKKRIAFAPFITLAGFANIIGFDIIKIYMEVIRNII